MSPLSPTRSQAGLTAGNRPLLAANTAAVSSHDLPSVPIRVPSLIFQPDFAQPWSLSFSPRMGHAASPAAMASAGAPPEVRYAFQTDFVFS